VSFVRFFRAPLHPKPLFNKIDEPTIDLIEDSIDDISDDSGWAFLGDVGNLIEEKPEFDPSWFCKIDSMLKSLTDILGNRRKEILTRKELNMFCALAIVRPSFLLPKQSFSINWLRQIMVHTYFTAILLSHNIYVTAIMGTLLYPAPPFLIAIVAS
jgi:hypothetical protein